MSWLFKSTLGLVLLFIVGLYLFGCFSPELPPIDPGEGWWGKEERSDTDKEDVSIRPFSISFPEDRQDDLKRRLNNTRFFESFEVTDWSYGTNADYMKNFVDYWLHKYSWAKQEKVINQFKHYQTNIEGIDIHFIHVKPTVKPGQIVKPILMVHGWPGSFYEFYKIIPMLTDPTKYGGTEKDVFEVICPSLPGYGFSEAAHRPDLDPRDIARIFHTLMYERLGFKGYYVQGGDWGGFVVEAMAMFYPDFVLGHHNNFIIYQPPLISLRILIGSICPCLVLSKKSDQDKLFPFGEYMKTLLLEEAGYSHIQATKPDTIGHALTDSPVGLAAYVLDKFVFWTKGDLVNHMDGGLPARFATDDLINNVMIYWISGSITSSTRLYKEFMDNVGLMNDPLYAYPVLVPTGVAAFPYEGVRIPEPWLHYKYKDLVSYTDMPEGGHFAALEEPKLLVDDIRQFVRRVEDRAVE